MTDHPSKVLRQLLLDAGLVSSDNATDWFITYEGVSDTPDKQVAVVTTTGRVDAEDQHGSLDERHAFQLSVRSSDPDAGHAKAVALRAHLLAVLDRWVTIGTQSYVVHNVHGLSVVIPAGKDRPNTNRSLFTVNGYTVIKEN